jgi:hypothetical protein
MNDYFPLEPLLTVELMAVRVSTGPCRRAVRRQVTIRFADGSIRTTALSTLESLRGQANGGRAYRLKGVVPRLTKLIAKAKDLMNRDPQTAKVVNEVKCANARPIALHRIESLRLRLERAIYQAGDVLEIADFEGKVVDLGEIGQLAIAANTMDS